MPLVSVIVPNYNHARYLPLRIESILRQTFSDFEVVILDDGSTDDSREIIQKYLDDSRVHFYPNDKNSGSPFIQWNHGVELAKGDYVWIAESDDFAEPTFLAELVPLLDANPRVGVAYCQSWRLDAEGHVSGTLLDGWDPTLDPSHWEREFTNTGRDECARYLLWKNTVPNASAVLLRRAFYQHVGGAPTDMRLCGDWLTWVRLLAASDVAFTPKCLNYFRHHAATVRAGTGWQRHLNEQWRVQSFILRTCPVPAAQARRLARKVIGEISDQVLPAPSGERYRLLRSCIAACGPILMRSPFTVGWACLGRSARALLRRVGLASQRAGAS